MRAAIAKHCQLIFQCIFQAPQSEEEFLFIQRFGDALESAKGEVERYLAGAKSAFYKACSEYQNVSTVCCLSSRVGFSLIHGCRSLHRSTERFILCLTTGEDPIFSSTFA